jgi:hypothetical protein
MLSVRLCRVDLTDARLQVTSRAAQSIECRSRLLAAGRERKN